MQEIKTEFVQSLFDKELKRTSNFLTSKIFVHLLCFPESTNDKEMKWITSVYLDHYFEFACFWISEVYLNVSLFLFFKVLFVLKLRFRTQA